jgi:lipoate-protein ligase B
MKNFTKINYEQALELQQKTSLTQTSAGWLLFEPPPTITLGSRATLNELKSSASDFIANGKIQLLHTQRGGLATYHGPGQVLGFPIGSLRSHTGDPKGVRHFVCKLENNILSLLAALGCKAHRIENKPGIYVEEKKIASLGVQFSQGKIFHGFAINVHQHALDGFEHIIACGENNRQHTSLDQHTEIPEFSIFKNKFEYYFPPIHPSIPKENSP